MAFVGASIYKTGKVECFAFDEFNKSAFAIQRNGSSENATIQATELNEMDFATFGNNVSIKKDGTIVASEFVEI